MLRMDKMMLTVMAALITGAAWTMTCDKSLDDFPALPGEGDAARIQRAINALPKGSLYIPRGEYRIDTTLMITNHCSLELNRGAVLKAVKPLPYVVKLNGLPIWKTWNMFFHGGIIDGDGLASCMAMDGLSGFRMRDVTFLNGKQYGLRLNSEAGGGGIFANGLYFRCLKKGLAGNIALWAGGNDGSYTDCLAVDWTVGFKITGPGNRLTGCHAWGGVLPPVAPDRPPEMLEDSICFHVAGVDNLLRDCYADTAETGYLVEGIGIQILGSWFLNNPSFKLRQSVIIDHRRGDLSVADCRFSNSKGVEVYRSQPGTRVAWKNNVYRGFGDETECPGPATFIENDVNLKNPDCTSPDKWEFVQDPGGLVYTSPAGEYRGAKKSRAVVIGVAREAMKRKFPDAGPGREVVIRARATTPDTKKVEISFTQRGNKTWGFDLPLTSEWRETRIPLAQLRPFTHWSKNTAYAKDEHLDARELVRITVFYGIWLCADSADKPHSFEISSIRITGR